MIWMSEYNERKKIKLHGKMHSTEILGRCFILSTCTQSMSMCRFERNVPLYTTIQVVQASKLWDNVLNGLAKTITKTLCWKLATFQSIRISTISVMNKLLKLFFITYKFWISFKFLRMFIQNLVYWVTLWAIYFIRVSWKWVNLKRNENFEHFSNIEKNFIFYKVSLFYFNYNVFSSFFSLESNRFFFAKKNFFWKSICHN